MKAVSGWRLRLDLAVPELCAEHAWATWKAEARLAGVSAGLSPVLAHAPNVTPQLSSQYFPRSAKIPRENRLLSQAADNT